MIHFYKFGRLKNQMAAMAAFLKNIVRCVCLTNVLLRNGRTERMYNLNK